jgi:hypothetical protein
MRALTDCFASAPSVERAVWHGLNLKPTASHWFSHGLAVQSEKLHNLTALRVEIRQAEVDALGLLAMQLKSLRRLEITVTHWGEVNLTLQRFRHELTFTSLHFASCVPQWCRCWKKLASVLTSPQMCVIRCACEYKNQLAAALESNNSLILFLTDEKHEVDFAGREGNRVSDCAQSRSCQHASVFHD